MKELMKIFLKMARNGERWLSATEEPKYGKRKNSFEEEEEKEEKEEKKYIQKNTQAIIKLLEKVTLIFNTQT